MKYIFFYFCLASLVGTVHAKNTDSLSDRYAEQALQGDLSQAVTLFAGEMSGASESAADSGLAVRFHNRFIKQSEDLSPATGDALIDSLVIAYREYWTFILMTGLQYRKGNDFLEDALAQVLSEAGMIEPFTPVDDVYERVGAVFDLKGYHYLQVAAPPHRDLFLWKSEQHKKYSVRLTDRTQNVQVTLMAELISPGWKQFATLGLVATTGWVEGARLYCVEGAYDRNSENFEVSYLKHESRHLADFERFPALHSAHLEYRAKLTELAFASASTRSLLDDFTAKSAPNPASPHAWANYRVTRDVYQEMFDQPFPESGDPWQVIDTQSVNKAARDLLRRDTEILQAVGAGHARSYFYHEKRPPEGSLLLEYGVP